MTTMKKIDFLPRPREHGKSQLIADLVAKQTAVRTATMTAAAFDLRAHSHQIQKALSREYPTSSLSDYLAAEKAAREAARKAYLETPEGKVEQVIEALNPPKPKVVPIDDMVDALRYSFGIGMLKPENVVRVSST